MLRDVSKPLVGRRLSLTVAKQTLDINNYIVMIVIILLRTSHVPGIGSPNSHAYYEILTTTL